MSFMGVLVDNHHEADPQPVRSNWLMRLGGVVLIAALVAIVAILS